ncbi:hypothetical protein E1B28_006379 [Marasmius oreades]|uniref:Hydrophobin n=1 Tax=Marasmius oreades TaxID=181124 RepID=A0A9P7UVQ7_9AGAR|nr:uncharacterized protein E1B28_006379 [Marasmius oreades]KAG7095660.1 hypothetical protein E1B28_006379 [Marasmius oreades]
MPLGIRWLFLTRKQLTLEIYQTDFIHRYKKSSLAIPKCEVLSIRFFLAVAMKFTSAFVIAAAALATNVSAAPGQETNAQRMARGLPPLPPVRRATGTEVARRGTPSGSPGQCSTGPVQCCLTTGHANDGAISALLGLLGIVVTDLNVLIGVNCSPTTVLGITIPCLNQAVCCQDNSHNGVLSIGCVPATI